MLKGTGTETDSQTFTVPSGTSGLPADLWRERLGSVKGSCRDVNGAFQSFTDPTAAPDNFMTVLRV